MAERPWRNFYGRRHGKALREGQARLVDTRLAELSPPGIGWEENPERRAIDLAALCPDARQVWLEIGFGGGEHMIAMAKAHADIHLIGAEPFINGVAKLLAAIERSGVRNLSVTDHDARDLLDVLPAASIGRVFLNYPDPWPKTRHHKRRFVSAEALDMLARVMAPGAAFHVATDIGDYARHTLVAVRHHSEFRWTAERALDWREPWADWPGTRYELKALREDRTPIYLVFCRI